MNRRILLLAGLLVLLIGVAYVAKGFNIGPEALKPPDGPESVPDHSPPDERKSPEAVKPPSEPTPKDSPIGKLSLPVVVIDQSQWLSLNRLTADLNGNLKYDPMEGTIEASIFGKRVRMLKEAPVLEVNGRYWPTGHKPLILKGSEEVYIPLGHKAFFESLEIEADSLLDGHINLVWDPAVAVTNPEDPSTILNTMDPDQMIEYLSFLSPPIEKAILSTKDSHLPGAPREYRNGFHEGIDWYFDQNGQWVNTSTPILAQADGLVVRADHDYEEFVWEERERILRISKARPHTPQYILDKLRGRSVWIQYDNGVMIRYAHLDSIADGLDAGTEVKRGDIIGYVGNSGTSSGVKGNKLDMHLHMDILIYGELFWKSLQPADIRYVLENIFTGEHLK